MGFGRSWPHYEAVYKHGSQWRYQKVAAAKRGLGLLIEKVERHMLLLQLHSLIWLEKLMEWKTTILSSFERNSIPNPRKSSRTDPTARAPQLQTSVKERVKTFTQGYLQVRRHPFQKTNGSEVAFISLLNDGENISVVQLKMKFGDSNPVEESPAPSPTIASLTSGSASTLNCTRNMGGKKGYSHSDKTDSI
ncbi:hypothetical protein Tco_0163301 [Tanacetum coccineum]